MGACFSKVFNGCPLKIHCATSWINPDTRGRHQEWGADCVWPGGGRNTNVCCVCFRSVSDLWSWRRNLHAEPERAARDHHGAGEAAAGISAVVAFVLLKVCSVCACLPAAVPPAVHVAVRHEQLSALHIWWVRSLLFIWVENWTECDVTQPALPIWNTRGRGHSVQLCKVSDLSSVHSYSAEETTLNTCRCQNFFFVSVLIDLTSSRRRKSLPAVLPQPERALRTGPAVTEVTRLHSHTQTPR